MVFASEGGMLVRIPVASISRVGRNTMGVRLVNLKSGDHVVAAAKIVDDEDHEPKEPDVEST